MKSYKFVEWEQFLSDVTMSESYASSCCSPHPTNTCLFPRPLPGCKEILERKILSKNRRLFTVYSSILNPKVHYPSPEQCLNRLTAGFVACKKA